jgi:hypothetical protein
MLQLQFQEIRTKTAGCFDKISRNNYTLLPSCRASLSHPGEALIETLCLYLPKRKPHPCILPVFCSRLAWAPRFP